MRNFEMPCRLLDFADLEPKASQQGINRDAVGAARECSFGYGASMVGVTTLRGDERFANGSCGAFVDAGGRSGLGAHDILGGGSALKLPALPRKKKGRRHKATAPRSLIA